MIVTTVGYLLCALDVAPEVVLRLQPVDAARLVFEQFIV